jgi:hypothetical protein
MVIRAAPPAREDRLDRPVDRDKLVIALALADIVVERGQQPLGAVRIGDAAGGAIALPKLGRRGVGFDRALQASRVIDDVVPIGRIGQFEPEQLGVVLRLLQPVRRGFVGGFRLDHRQRKIARVAQPNLPARQRRVSGDYCLCTGTTNLRQVSASVSIVRCRHPGFRSLGQLPSGRDVARSYVAIGNLATTAYDIESMAGHSVA